MKGIDGPDLFGQFFFVKGLLDPQREIVDASRDAHARLIKVIVNAAVVDEFQGHQELGKVRAQTPTGKTKVIVSLK